MLLSLKSEKTFTFTPFQALFFLSSLIGCSIRRQYPPVTLLELQRLIDLNRVDTSRPVDVTSICNTGLFKFDVSKNHFGVNLTDEVWL